MKIYDVIVGGSGPAGLSAANTLLQAGLSVAIISNGFGRPRGTDFIEGSAFQRWQKEFECEIPIFKDVPVYREVSNSGRIVDTKGVWGENGFLLGHPDVGRGPAFQAMLDALVLKGVDFIPGKISNFKVDANKVEVDYGEVATCKSLILAVGSNYGNSLQSSLDAEGIEKPFTLHESMYEVELNADLPDLCCVSYSLELSRLHGWLLDESKDGEGQVTIAVCHLDGEDPDYKLKNWENHPYYRGKLKVKGGRFLRYDLAWAPSRKIYSDRVITCGETAGYMFPDMLVMSMTNAYRGGKMAADVVIKNIDNPSAEALSELESRYENEIKKYGYVDMQEWHMDLYTAFINHDPKAAERIFDEFAGEPFPRMYYEIARSWRVHRSPPGQHETYMKALNATVEQGGDLAESKIP
jgi:flavin-dependent dehydrogenase